MAVKLPITMLNAGMTSTQDAEQRTYAAQWLVETTDSADNQVVVANALRGYLGQPWAGFGNGQDLEAICVSITPSRVPDSTKFWIVQGKWETPQREDQSDDNGNPTDNPLDWRDRVEVGSAKFTVPVESAKLITDLAGVGRPANSEGPVIAASGEVLDPPLEKEEAYRIYRITRMMKNFPAEQLDEYENAVNSDVVTLVKDGLKRTFQKYTLKMEPATSALQYHRRDDGSEIFYWAVPYEVHHKKSGWRRKILNMGHHRRATAGDPDGRGGTISNSDLLNGQPHMRRVVDADDNPMGKVMLDLDGQPLAMGADPVYLTYAVHDELPFKKLGIWGKKRGQ